MNLNQQDKRDLAGLLSGLGGSESQNRARVLIDTRPEASDYYRQMSLLSEALQPPADDSSPELPPDQLELVLDAVSSRLAKRRDAGRVSRLAYWRLPGFGAAAAALLIAFCGTWIVWTGSLSDQQRSIGELVSVPVGYAGAGVHDLGKVFPGQVVTAAPDVPSRIDMSNGTVVIVTPWSAVQVGEDGKSFEIRAGIVRIFAEVPITVRAGGLTAQLQESVSQVQIFETATSLTLYRGKGMVSTHGGSSELAAGFEARWDESTHSLSVAPVQTPTPSWVGSMLTP